MSTVFDAAAKLQSAGAAEELLVIAVRATVILLLARLLLVALPNASARTRFRVATAGLVAVLLLPLATAMFPSWQVNAAQNAESIGVSDSEESTLRTAISIARVTGVVPESPLTALDRATQLVTTTWKGWIVLVVLTPSFLLLLHTLYVAWTGWRTQQAAPPGPRTSTPAALANRIAVAFYWFHPLAWSVEKQATAASTRILEESMEPTPRPRTAPLFGRRALIIASVAALLVIAPLAVVRVVASSEREAVAAQAATPSAGPSGTTVDVTPDFDVLGDLVAVGIAKAAGRDELSLTPTDADDWYDRAWKLYRTERYAEAAKAFETAAGMKYRTDLALYNAACSHSLSGNADAALTALQGAMVAGWDDLEKIGEDSDLDPLRDDPRFARLLRDDSIATARLTNTMKRFETMRASSEPPSKHDSEEWVDLGSDLLSLRRHDEAAYAFQQAAAGGEMSGKVAYNIACAETLSGDVESGIVWLDRAIEHGFSSKHKLNNDPDIARLRHDPRFEPLRVKAADLELRSGLDSGVLRLLAFNNDWKDAKEHHRRMTAKYPTSGRAWFNLGYAALQARDFGAAQQAYRKTIDLQYRVGTSSYNMACAYALDGNEDAAFEWLHRSRAAGFELASYLNDDRDLRSLRRDPRWKQLVSEVKRDRKKSSRIAFSAGL